MPLAKRLLFIPLFIWSLIALTVVLYGTIDTVKAQADEPTIIIDAAFKDLSQRLGRSLTRATSSYSWDQIVFPDSSLGCPAPGMMYSQVLTKGYKIIITDKGTMYDYRAGLGATGAFLCTPNGPAAATGTGATAAPTSITVGGATATPAIVPPIVNPTAAGPTQPVNYTTPLAYGGVDGNIYITALGLGNGTALTADGHPMNGPIQRFYHTPLWSLDGSHLVFSEANTNTLYLAASGQAPAQIASNMASGNAYAWSPDGKEVAYVVTTNQPVAGATNGSAVTMQIQAYPVTGGAPRVAGTFTQMLGCGGGDVDPAEGVYASETGFGGNYLSLIWIDQGFVYSTSCSGTGLALIDATGQIKWQQDKLHRLVVSPDRKRGAALDDKGLVIVDLTTGATTAVLTNPAIDQLAWSSDGNAILYSTVEALPNVKGNPARVNVGSQIIQVWPYDGLNYKVSLFQIPAAGGQPTSLFSQEGRGIGVIAPVPGGNNILISFITSSAALVQQINAGATVAQAKAAYPTVDIYSVTPGGVPAKLVSGGRPTFSSAATFAVLPAIPPTTGVTCPGFLPSRLIVGQKGRVTPGNPNRIRTDPGSGAILGTMPPGGVFTVLAGPTCTSNGIAWWQVTYNTLTGWTGEGQNNAYWVEPIGG